MGHKGIREWSGEELSSVALGQNGFHVINGAGTTTAASKDVEYWIAIKNVNGTAGLQARSILPGDDLAEDGTQSTSAGNNIDLVDGDIVYGAFDQIYMDQVSEYVIAYIGK